MPSHVWMLGPMVFVEGEDLFGGFGGELLEFDLGGKSEPDWWGKDGGLEITQVGWEPEGSES